MPRKRDEEDRKRREKLARASLKRVKALDADLSARSAAAVRAIPEEEWERAEAANIVTEAEKKGPGRGWWGPPKGDSTPLRLVNYSG